MQRPGHRPLVEENDGSSYVPSPADSVELSSDQASESLRETIAHIRRVQQLLDDVCGVLSERGRFHDASKLDEPEASAFATASLQLSQTEYGSDEYNASLSELAPALTHHYKNNRHHPEHWAGGVRDMTLIDMIEMLVDWKAAGERHKDGSIAQSLDRNRIRFKYGEEIDRILCRTAAELWPDDGCVL